MMRVLNNYVYRISGSPTNKANQRGAVLQHNRSSLAPKGASRFYVKKKNRWIKREVDYRKIELQEMLKHGKYPNDRWLFGYDFFNRELKKLSKP